MPPQKPSDDFVYIEVFQEEKRDKGTSVFESSLGKTSKVYIEDIKITTSLDKEVTPIGMEPHIQPMGVKSRECVITGSFDKNMPMEGTPEYANNDDLFRGIFEKKGYLGKAIKFIDTNEHVLELSYGEPLWLINDFTWDRNAKEMGKYRFTMTCGYFWSQGAAETQIYSEDFTKHLPNVQFFANSLDGVPIRNVRIQKSRFAINRGTFEVFGEDLTVAKDDLIDIWCDSDDKFPVISGIVEKFDNIDTKTIRVTMVEIGQSLYQTMIVNRDKGLFVPRVQIRNPVSTSVGPRDLKLEEMLKAILTFYETVNEYECKSGIDTSKKYGKDIYIPQTKKKLPPMVMSGMTVGTAVDMLITQNCGLDFWFDRENENQLTYGYVNKARQIEVSSETTKTFAPILKTVQVSSAMNDITTDVVVVFNNSGDFQYSGVGPKTVAFKLNTDVPSLSLQEFASRLYRDLTLDRSQYKVTFPAGVVCFSENDVFGNDDYGLGDSTIRPVMEWRHGEVDIEANPEIQDSPLWQIKDVVITSTYTEVVVGPSLMSVFDLFGEAIQPVDGAPTPTETKTEKVGPGYTKNT